MQVEPHRTPLALPTPSGHDMSSTLDRLRRLNQLRPARDIPPPDKTHTPNATHLERRLNGQEVITELGPCVVSTHAYPLHAQRGDFSLGALLAQRPDPIARLYPDFSLRAIGGFQDAAFLDTETTGLGTGASVYAFMVGIGTFETVAESDAHLAR